MKQLFCVLIFSFSITSAMAQEPEPYGPVPSERQMEWQKMEFYAFVHFNMNTFLNEEWSYGDADPIIFNPTQFNARQWARLAKKAGMKGIILTVKHHDGFCLWPSDYTQYDVENSPWRDGQGDVVQELREAANEYGLELGIYLSPWDRHHPDYGKPEYLTFFRNQLRELLTEYGDIFEVWFDGANGGDGYYGGANETRNVDRKTYYKWEETYDLVRELQPDAVIFSDAGPDVRWVGTEAGFANKTNWSLLRRDEVWPGWPHYKQLRSGHEDGTHWVPAEVNTSIRPGWYYHASEDHKVKSLPELMDVYYHSVGRNGTFLLNLPVDRRGLVHEADSARLMQLADQIRKDFDDNLAIGKPVNASEVRNNNDRYEPGHVTDGNPETYWAADDGHLQAALTIDLGHPQVINRFLVQEYIQLGQRVKEFTVEAYTEHGWKDLADETTIGYKRILRFPDIKASKIRFSVTDAKASPVISNIELYRAPAILSKPTVWRSQQDTVHIEAADPDAAIYYTTDGSSPSQNLQQYEGPFHWPKKGSVRAIITDSHTGKSSSVAFRYFDISKADWKLVDPAVEPGKANAMWDGRRSTQWGTKISGLPGSIAIDLGKQYNLDGITYLPDQGRYASGIVRRYIIYVSNDAKKWQKVAEGEFSNIRNNPVTQEVVFQALKGRYIKFEATDLVDDTGQIRVAEFGVSTK